MNASIFKRIISFFIDTIFVLALVVFLFRFVARPLIEDSIDNFDALYASFLDAQETRFDEVVAVQESFDAGEITESEYTTRLEEIDTTYNENYAAESQAYAQFLYTSALFFILGLTLFNYLYQGFTKGKTVGRRITKLRLSGPINWWTLLLREVFWKSIYWVFTLGFGIFIDFILISLTSQRKTIRDYLTKTKVVVEDTLYPI